MAIKKAAREGDPHTCEQMDDIPHIGGKIIEGAKTVTIEGKPAARVGDPVDCLFGSLETEIVTGSKTVFIEGKAAAMVSSETGHGSVVSDGASRVFIGDEGPGKITISGNVHIGKNVYLNCRLGSAAKPVAVKPISPIVCAEAWDEVIAETEIVLQQGGDENPEKRNKHISKAYAELYLENESLQWSGLAAFVSRQAGCAMDDAKSVSESMDVFNARGTENAAVASQAMADANKEIFVDIYPVMSFYNKHGLEGIERCGQKREDKAIPEKLIGALQMVDSEDPDIQQDGADMIADYEQCTVIQEGVYDNDKVVKAFKRNEYWSGWWIGRKMGAKKSEIPLSTQCGEGEPVPFEGSILNPDDRVNYYHELMEHFQQIPDARSHMHDIIQQTP